MPMDVRFSLGGMVRRTLLAALAMSAAVMVFASDARAQYVSGYAHDECLGAFEEIGLPHPNYLNYIPDVGGCVILEGAPILLIAALNAEVYDPDTGEVIGIVKDLDPDLSSGENSVTYEEFCGVFIPEMLTAQDYYDQDANAAEQAILDPDSDGLACTDADDAFLAGDVVDLTGDVVGPSGEDDPCANAIGGLVYVPAVHGCLTTETVWHPIVGIVNGPVYDADEVEEALSDDTGTVVAPWDEPGRELGIFKDLVDIDDMYEQIGLDVNYEDFCGSFPTTNVGGYEVDGVSLGGLTAQEYYDQLANDQEQAILDPNSDGLACTPDDEAFLSGGGDEPEAPEFDGSEFEDTWTGTVTQTNPDGDTLEFDLEAEMMPLSDITDEMVGEVVGEIAYPGIGCSGVWILDGFEGDSMVVDERITEGRDVCFETPSTLTPQPDGSLEYYFLDDDGVEGECVLTLEGSPPTDVATAGRKPSEIMNRLGINELPDTGGPAIFSPLVGALFLASGILGVVALWRRA